MQLHIEYSWITNRTSTAFPKRLKHFSDEFQLPMSHSLFKQSAQNVHQMQQYTIEDCSEICLNINELLQQIIPYRQQNFLSAQKCWSALACISGSVPALRPIHDNSLAYQSGEFSVMFRPTSKSVITCLLIKMYFWVQIKVFFK